MKKRRLGPAEAYLLHSLAAISVAAAFYARVQHEVPALALAGVCGSAVVSAALLIAWSAEGIQFTISKGLVVAIVALLQVLPEFAVEATLSWSGQVPYMMANATGSVRLLIGLAWSVVLFTAAVAHRVRRREGVFRLRLPPEILVETGAFAAAMAWFGVILAKRTLTLLDTAVLGGIYVLYMLALYRLPPEEKEEIADLVAPARFLAEDGRGRPRMPRILLYFALGGGAIFAVAEPFVESLKASATVLGIPPFFFIQWLAPFLSEFPESCTAFYWAQRVKLAPMALRNMVSSTVNQWTLLFAMIPFVYWISPNGGRPVPIDDGHARELLLSMSMTVYGMVVLFSRRVSIRNALTLFVLWVAQLLLPSLHVQLAALFGGLTLFEVGRRWKETNLRADLRHTWGLLRGRHPE
ncbi:MAG TPA: hypothetical protein VFI25_07390 [Planctomycetota bacterium]|jgi:cation:H+ antiporter|nr:hypothetical protein [Planctomycetota bacterium]